MRLIELDIKNFGRFCDKKFKLQDGIHLVCGENESGKSTVHAFIKAMLFGLERGRGRASAKDDFSRYEPWENGNYYAGSLRFECGGKMFCLQRNFDKASKKAALTCETDGEELSVADGDLAMLLNGLTLASYENTLCIGQLRVHTGQALASEVKNYATNYYVSGDSDIDLAAAQDCLLARKKETDRAIKQKLLEKQKRWERTEQEAAYVWRDIHRMDMEIEDTEAELALRQAEEEKQPDHMEGEKEWRKIRFTDILRPAKWRVHPIEILAILIMCVLAFVLLPNPFNDIVTIVVALLGAIYIWNRMKLGKKNVKTEPEKLLEDLAAQEEGASAEKLRWQADHLKRERQEKQVEYDNLKEQLQEMTEMEDGYIELDRKKKAIALAGERLGEISAELQKEFSVCLNGRASEILAEITGGKYDRLMADENLNLSVFHEGSRVAAERLSEGTMEQLYFALRMTVAELLYGEDYPVLLDDTFAFYDDARLTRTLSWLGHCGRQVLLFTCQSREEEILKRNGIHYAKTIL